MRALKRVLGASLIQRHRQIYLNERLTFINIIARSSARSRRRPSPRPA